MTLLAGTSSRLGLSIRSGPPLIASPKRAENEPAREWEARIVGDGSVRIGQNRTPCLQERQASDRPETGHTRRTIRKVLPGQEPKYRRENEPACPAMDPVIAPVVGGPDAEARHADQTAPDRHPVVELRLQTAARCRGARRYPSVRGRANGDP